MAKKDRIGKTLTDWIKEVAAEYKKKVNAANIRYTGDLEDLISYGVRSDSSKDILSTATTFEAFLVLAEEWKYVEDGRLSGTFPNLTAMLKYVRGKPVIPRPYVLPTGRQVIPTENQLAYLVGHKIEEDGIPPNPLLYETLEEMRPKLIEAIRSSVSEEVRDNLKLMFET